MATTIKVDVDLKKKTLSVLSHISCSHMDKDVIYTFYCDIKSKGVQESFMTHLSTARCFAVIGMVAMVCAEPQQFSLPAPTIPGHMSV